MLYVIKKDLSALEEGLQAEVHSDVPLITEMGRHLIAAGGKRLRPALYFLAARSDKNYNIKHALPLAITIELIHMASLVHDDVLDNAMTRRGVPTANARWGNNISILGGDFLFARAFALIAGMGYDQRILVRLASVICGLSEGEIHQNELHYKIRTESQYNDAIAKKTADFIAASCEIGGIVAGLSPKETDALYSFGKNLGMAFQVTDDILDLISNDKKLGKPAGNDILQGIITLPVLRALNTAAEKDELYCLITNKDITREQVQRAVEIVRQSDGIAYARAAVEKYIENAKNDIPASLPHTIRESFWKVADYVIKRDF